MSLKDMKMDLIIDKALELFLNDSILNVTIKDISSKLEIGEMTIYRYFKTKDNLVLQCAIKLQKEFLKIILILKKLMEILIK